MSNSSASITLEKQDAFVTSQEKYKMPLINVPQQSKNSLRFFLVRSQPLMTYAKNYLHRTLEFLTKNKFDNFVYIFYMLANKTKNWLILSP